MSKPRGKLGSPSLISKICLGDCELELREVLASRYMAHEQPSFGADSVR